MQYLPDLVFNGLVLLQLYPNQGSVVDCGPEYEAVVPGLAYRAQPGRVFEIASVVECVGGARD